MEFRLLLQPRNLPKQLRYRQSTPLLNVDVELFEAGGAVRDPPSAPSSTISTTFDSLCDHYFSATPSTNAISVQTPAYLTYHLYSSPHRPRTLVYSPLTKYSFTRLPVYPNTRILVLGEILVYSLLVYFPLANARLLVTRIFPLGNHSFTRMLVCSYARMLVCPHTRPRGAIHLLAFLLNVYLPPDDYI